MRSYLPLVLIVVGLFVLNRSCNPGVQGAKAGGGSGTRLADSVQGGPVRQLESQPRQIMDMQQAMPAPAAGGSTQTMLDTARAAQK